MTININLMLKMTIALSGSSDKSTAKKQFQDFKLYKCAVLGVKNDWHKS